MRGGSFSYHIARREAEARGMTLSEYCRALGKRGARKKAAKKRAEEQEAKFQRMRESRPDLYD